MFIFLLPSNVQKCDKYQGYIVDYVYEDHYVIKRKIKYHPQKRSYFLWVSGTSEQI